MDDFISEANKKGLQVVDHNNTERLEEDFSDKIAEAELLAEKDSTEAQPFEHKYKARELLDQLCSQLEATKSIAMLEAKKGVINCMNWRIASVKVRIGTLSWECEEPHNAQTELEAACSFYFNDITTDIDAIVAKQGGDESTDDVTVSDIEELIPPIVCEQPPHSAADAMKCLNMLGILWAGRGQVRKSFLYLMAANNFYHLTIDSKTNSANSTKLPKYVAKELNVVYTHNIFYLAQAYGNLGDVKKSSYYCKLTLQRQLNNGLQDVKSSMDWAKNCASISDFYKTMRQFNNCALALASAEKIMKENVIKIIYDSIAAKDYTIDAQKDTQTTNSTDGGAPSSAKKLDGAAKHHTAAVELEAEIHKKWAALDVLILKRAYEQLSEYRNAQELGIDISKLDLEDPDSEDDYKYPLKETGEPMNSEEVNASLFEGMWVHPTPLLSSGSIAEFEQARKVFLRAASRIEAAKKHFVLDGKAQLLTIFQINMITNYSTGYVTEHVLLLQQHSKLYHYLSLFETDTKRKLAMESRRLEMLTPLLKSLNIAAYEILHKQVT